ncbi:MAG: flagellar biosynthetic protein FliO [Spirochaetes bacterium]|nr:flagellar biosynthetic protein FliO [Spirochaetota bacterium]
MCLLSSVVVAQETKKSAPQNTPNEKELVFSENQGPVALEDRTITSFGIWDFLRMLLILGFVLALVYGFFHYLKKLSSPRETGLEIIRLLESKALSGNKQLHLVEVGEHVVLIGTAESSIQLILELKDKETIDAIRLKVSELPPGRHPNRFIDLVRQYFHRKPDGGAGMGFNSSGKKETPGDESLEFIRKQRERLSKLH